MMPTAEADIGESACGQRWCGLLPSLVGAEGDQCGPVVA
jgi:hypothetical protein